ncbi:serine hydrolase [bacterium]|nr:serine hydrolase [bacterium]
MSKKIITICVFLMICMIILSCSRRTDKPDLLSKNQKLWVDTIIQNLTLEEQIAQLIWIPVSNVPKQQEETLKIIKEYNVGGVIFFKNKVDNVVTLINQYQHISKIPLMIAIDAEWGPGMRLTDTMRFPYAMTLGALQNDSLIQQMGEQIGRQLKRVGVNMNLAPVVDVNTNPENPVIGYRSFGENKEKVARKGLAYVLGIQSQGIIATAKHFPGHGDTHQDSHLILPTVKSDAKKLRNVELYPFKKLIDGGVLAVMSAHLNVPAIAKTNTPATLSSEIITDLLKKELGFKGLVVSDAMNMQGLTRFSNSSTVEPLALLAGNDVLEFVNDVPQAIENIKNAVTQGIISAKLIKEKCRKVLEYKTLVNLPDFKPIVKANLYRDLHSPEALLLNHKLFEAAATLIQNKNNTIPLNTGGQKIAGITISPNPIANNTSFQNMLNKYTDVDHFMISDKLPEEKLLALQKKLAHYDKIIISLQNFRMTKARRHIEVNNYKQEKYDMKPYGLSRRNEIFINTLINRQAVTIVHFGIPYMLSGIKKLKNADAILLLYQDNYLSQKIAAQAVFGGIPITGILPVTINKDFPAGTGFVVEKAVRLGYTLPEAVGMNSSYINQRVDSIIHKAIKEKAFPGCQILVAKNKKIIFHKTYGYHTYDKKHPVKLNDLYDLASITKIATALPALMKLNEEDKFNLDEPVSKYWKDWRHSNKESLTFREVLSHQARLLPYIAFHKETQEKDGTLKKRWYSKTPSTQFPIHVAEEIYLNKDYTKRMFKRIRESPLLKEAGYKYSGLSFLIFPDLIEQFTGQKYSDYLNTHFYNPLGASSLTFTPLTDYPKERIIPTENDKNYRQQILQGYVHDEAAAMRGGLSGNAGLFGTANDLAKLMQMYVQSGEYGNKQYIKQSTFDEYTRVQFPEKENRRGLGFDKPMLDNKKKKMSDSYPAPAVSQRSFGHSGYTGTFVWIDPDEQLVYIFLSNRVYPTRENSKIYSLNVRSAIQQIFYDAEF